MNNKSPATQPSQAVVPTKVIQPSKAVVPTGQKSTMTPTTQGKQHTGFAVLAVIELPKEDIANLLKAQVPQQSTNITVNNNTQIINNYYNSPPPEAQNPGQQGGSRERLHQGPQTTASASRAIEDKAHGVDNVPSALKSTQKTQEKSQNGSGDKVNSSRPTTVQTRLIQDKPRAETSSAPITKSTTGQVPSRPAQDGNKKPESRNVSAGQVPGQARRETPQPKGSQIREFIDKIRHPDPPRENGSRPKKTAPASATTSPARGSNHPSGNREDPAVKQSQSRAKPQAAVPRSQPPSEPRESTAPEQPVAKSQQRGSQPAKREEPAGVAHGHSTVTKPEDHGTGAVPEIPKELSEKGIRKYLEDLNSRLGNPQMGTSSGPARLILLGKASAKMMELKTDQKVYHIDVMLEGGERLKQVRQCMTRMGVFREFDKQEPDVTKVCKTFFGRSAHRAVVFNDVFREGKCVYNKKHVKAYLMDAERAFEFELRRMADPGNDEHITNTSKIIAEAILWSMIERGCDPVSRNKCRTQRYINADYNVPEKSINEVMELYKVNKHKKLGIIGT